jgi:hypothetical protein
VLKDAFGHSAVWFCENQMPLKIAGQENVYYWLAIEVADIFTECTGHLIQLPKG